MVGLAIASCVAALVVVYEWGWWHNAWLRLPLAAGLTALLMAAIPLPPCRPGAEGCTDWPFWAITFGAMLVTISVLGSVLPKPEPVEEERPRIPAGFGPLRNQMRGAWRKGRTRKYQGYTVRR